MAQFPRTEAEIVALAEAMASGIGGGENPSPHFPTPPIPSPVLTEMVNSYTLARNAAIAAQATAEQATVTKNTRLQELTDGMKSNLRYAENTVNYDDEILKQIGWGGRKPRTSLQAPGQARLLTARTQGEGWLHLEWKAPVDGGRPSAYRIMRRERPAGPWSDVGTAVTTEATLTDQLRGKEFEYNVVALNKAGEGPASNTVMVIL